jgi:hypothetical protein
MTFSDERKIFWFKMRQFTIVEPVMHKIRNRNGCAVNVLAADSRAELMSEFYFSNFPELLS